MERGISRTFLARIASRSVFAPKPLMERAVFASITISTVYCPPVRSVLGSILTDRYPPRLMGSSRENFPLSPDL